MDNEFEPRSSAGVPTALDRARQLSHALSEVARRARFSTRSKRVFSSGGFQARRGAGLMRFLIWGSFLVMVLIPTLAMSVYYGLIASDQYVAEAEFTVTGGEPPPLDGVGALTGIPAAAIVQDTQIVTNYILSRAAAERLDEMLRLRDRYSRSDIDFAARFDPADPIERFVRYWKDMCQVSIKMPSGIVDLRVRAFSPDDALDIVHGVLAISERLINEMNGRMNADAVRNTEQELERATKRLTEARLALERARNDEGILDTTRTGEALTKLITELRSNLITMQREYMAQSKSVNETAPQMRALKARIDAARTYIGEIESKLTSEPQAGAQKSTTLATSMTRFAELDLERQIAERLYAGAATALEAARMLSEHKYMYLNTFLEPVRPGEPQYPKRGLYSLMTLVIGLCGWGAFVAVSVLVRDNMA
jgi:capsular polysaccharide transport system permease protein